MIGMSAASVQVTSKETSACQHSRTVRLPLAAQFFKTNQWTTEGSKQRTNRATRIPSWNRTNRKCSKYRQVDVRSELRKALSKIKRSCWLQGRCGTLPGKKGATRGTPRVEALAARRKMSLAEHKRNTTLSHSKITVRESREKNNTIEHWIWGDQRRTLRKQGNAKCLWERQNPWFLFWPVVFQQISLTRHVFQNWAHPAPPNVSGVDSSRKDWRNPTLF